jgi:hypothetical protein
MSQPTNSFPSTPTAPIAVRCPPGRDTVRWLNARHQHHPTAVTVNPPACLRLEVHEVAEAALDNMGHDASLATGIRPAEALAAAWLHARGVTDALFVDCQVHPADRVRRAIEWFQGLGIRVWLCITRDDPLDLHAAAIETLTTEHGGSMVNYDFLRKQFPDRNRTATAPEGRLPNVPLVDVLAFRPACKELLSPQEFKQVDAMFLASLGAVLQALGSITDRKRTRAACKVFRRALEQTGSVAEFVVTTRAIQAAALRYGMNVRVSVPLLLGGEATIPRRGKLDTEGAWKALARYRDPDVGAVAAIYHRGVDPDLLPRLTVADVALQPDGAAVVSTPDGNHEVTGEPALFLRALVHYRRLTAANPTASLFHTHRDEQVQVSHLSAILATPAQETGHQLCTKRVYTNQLPDELWLSRHGIQVAMIRRRDAKVLKAKKGQR